MAPDDVHVWSLALPTIADAEWQTLGTVLREEEHAQAARYHFDRDRRAYVAAHALVRHMLAHLAGGDPRAWRFVAGEHGKPRIANPPPGLDVAFNLTHSHQMVAAAVTLAGEIGVDVEALDRRSMDPAIADEYFAPEESAALRALPDERAMRELFVRLWTLKEAFIKATGRGLAQPLSDFAFVSTDPVRIVFHDGGLGDPARWAFWQRQVGCHVLAVGIDRRHSQPPRFIHREISPPFPSRHDTLLDAEEAC